MKPTSKTPYEIRLELLQLAQIILQNKYEADPRTNTAKSAPTTAEIVAEAETLNAFVSKANPNH
jgi:hypothetical protein